eukprot:CAMPEP_0196156092 /NCGR_PEP_ID=MMETSP0910-20130528/41719_1 /TAXON_ID=49265 /ORGANISM="Thalassiosira rotula, Strain GSO102" /LENGTH=78 /DNA_ID=CAMNT_0041420433 /DNA_START=71 /DNA_END=307 /DNA_ORIENTATION=+
MTTGGYTVLPLAACASSFYLIGVKLNVEFVHFSCVQAHFFVMGSVSVGTFVCMDIFMIADVVKSFEIPSVLGWVFAVE